jgi:hypothetical protein
MLGVDEWNWDDPTELRLRLDVALQEIAELREENDLLHLQLGSRAPAVPAQPSVAVGDLADRPARPPQSMTATGLPYADASWR